MMPGSGQTLVALGLMRALRQRNLRVQSFKCGPELADLRYHALAADREPVSLDTWLSSRSHLQTVYTQPPANRLQPLWREVRRVRGRRTGRFVRRIPENAGK